MKKMSGISTTIFFEDLIDINAVLSSIKDLGTIKKLSDRAFEFRINQNLFDNGYEMVSEFLIEVSTEMVNESYPNDLWNSLIKTLPSSKSYIDLSSMSRNEQTTLILIKLIISIGDKKQFWLVNDVPNQSVLKKFKADEEKLKIASSCDNLYLMSKEVIEYIFNEKLLTNLGNN